MSWLGKDESDKGEWYGTPTKGWKQKEMYEYTYRSRTPTRLWWKKYVWCKHFSLPTYRLCALFHLLVRTRGEDVRVPGDGHRHRRRGHSQGRGKAHRRFRRKPELLVVFFRCSTSSSRWRWSRWFCLIFLFFNCTTTIKRGLSLQHFPRARVVVHATNSSVSGRECRRHLHVVVSFFTLLPSIKSV